MGSQWGLGDPPQQGYHAFPDGSAWLSTTSPLNFRFLILLGILRWGSLLILSPLSTTTPLPVQGPWLSPI